MDNAETNASGMREHPWFGRLTPMTADDVGNAPLVEASEMVLALEGRMIDGVTGEAEVTSVFGFRFFAADEDGDPVWTDVRFDLGAAKSFAETILQRVDTEEQAAQVTS